MRIALYLDEDSQDSDLVQALRLREVDVLTAAEAGMAVLMRINSITLRHRDASSTALMRATSTACIHNIFFKENRTPASSLPRSNNFLSVSRHED